jgi:hypothetical protein
MCSRLTATGFVASCILLAAYWGLSTPLQDQPRYGYYSHRFVAFVSSYPIPGYADQYQFLGGAAAALGAFHALNPPVLITISQHPDCRFGALMRASAFKPSVCLSGGGGCWAGSPAPAVTAA